jgi:cation diffusion facilitator family transporter
MSASTESGAGSGARYRATRRATWTGIGANLGLAVVKIATGVWGQSQALVADGVHSISDLASDAVVLLAAHHAAFDPDADHPYGHARIETAATVVVAILLAATAALLGLNALQSLTTPPAGPVGATLAIALIAVLAKEALFRYTRRIARAIDSRLLAANAWHHRSDALSSIVVAVGIAGALAGWPVADAVAAIIVAVMIAKVAWDLMAASLRELVDTGLDQAERARLTAAARAVDGVRRVHTLRSRWMGASVLLDLHIQVGPRVSVSEGHRIAEAVAACLRARQPRLGDVLVHVDPEDDTGGGPSNHLPLRAELVGRLWQRWTGLAALARIEDLTLHYLGGVVHVRLTLAPAAEGVDANAEAEALRRASAADPAVGSVTVLERRAPL